MESPQFVARTVARTGCLSEGSVSWDKVEGILPESGWAIFN